MTYMISYEYLDHEACYHRFCRAPKRHHHRRGCHRALLAMTDTVSEMRPEKHSFDAGVMAPQGIYW